MYYLWCQQAPPTTSPVIRLAQQPAVSPDLSTVSGQFRYLGSELQLVQLKISIYVSSPASGS
jgi:hypothetical protein